MGEFRSPREIGRLPLDDRGLRLADVAEVRYDFPEQETFNYLNGVADLFTTCAFFPITAT
jgi:multidrug efflux pump subunit AcrB